jgi:hypothetical protein
VKIKSDVASTISTDHDDRVTGNNAALISCYYPSQHQVPKLADTFTLTAQNCSGIRGDSPLVHECYAIDSKSSNSMKSQNPHSGFQKEDVIQTLRIRSGKEGGGKGALVQDNISATLGCGNDQTLFYVHGAQTPICEAVAIAENIIGRKVENGGNGIGAQDELAYTQNASGVMGVCTKGISSTVRRLIPIECERLMGFPDNHTRIPWKGKPAEECPDAPRYKACGNSMCVNVMRWIGEQIDNVDKMEQGDEH